MISCALCVVRTVNVDSLSLQTLNHILGVTEGLLKSLLEQVLGLFALYYTGIGFFDRDISGR